MPTLLVDVCPNDKDLHFVRLHDVQSQTMNYVAFSYCWGGSQPAATTTLNFGSYLDSLNVETLPQSIQDAIWVTRKLGIRYLWGRLTLHIAR